MRRTLLLIAVAALALVGAAVVRADSGAPAGFFDKSYRLSVTLQDWNSPVFDTTLNDIASTTPSDAAAYLSQSVGDTTFGVDVSQAQCFEIGNTAAAVPCSAIGALLDAQPTGGIDAVIQARPVANADGSLDFAAKKVTVWIDPGTGAVVSPPSDWANASPPTVPAPPKLFTKNVRLNLNLEDVNGLVFDATMNDIASRMPDSWAAYLHQELDSATFEVDAGNATCFEIKHSVSSTVPCSAIGALLDASPDGGLDVIAQVRAIAQPDGLSFTAKKITVWL